MKKHTPFKIVLRILTVILLLVALILVFLTSTIATVFLGPSDTMKDLLVSSFMETSALKFIPRIFFSDEEIDVIMHDNTEAYNAYIASLEAVEIEIPEGAQSEIMLGNIKTNQSGNIKIYNV